MAVEIVHFNPNRRRSGFFGRLMPRQPLNNFGDLIGPMLVRRIVSDLGLNEPSEHRRLVAVGSIMKLTQPGDVVWGAGVNGKSLGTGAAPDLDVRAVRGPLTRELLIGAGAAVPEVYGDPALLWARYWPRQYYLGRAPRTRSLTVVPNYNDAGGFRGPAVVSPLGAPHEVIREIAISEFVCGSSLHAIVLAESFGIPARLIRSEFEPTFKYDDYYGGTGRDSYAVASTLDEAIKMGGEQPPRFDAESLMRAFPVDLFPSSGE